MVRESFAAREDYPKLSTDAKHLKDVTSKLVNLRLDHTEFTCLKALALFKPDVCGLRNHVQVEVLQDQTHLMLQEYCNSKAQLSAGKLRFGKILLTMPIISQVRIFFKSQCQSKLSYLKHHAFFENIELIDFL